MTIRVDIDRTIDAPIEDVFDRLVDLDAYDHWMSKDGLFRGTTKTSDGPISKGTEFRDSTRVGHLSGQVTEHEPPTRLAFRQTLSRRGSPIFESRPAYVLEPIDDGARTVVHHGARGDFHGAYQLLEPVFIPIARRERRLVLDSLQASLEA